MTSEERLDRIEHLTAGIAEERRKDRDEYKALWRDTQRQLNDLGNKILQLSEETLQFAEESRKAAKEAREAAQESREADKRLEERIASLVSGFGKFIVDRT